MTQLSEVAQQVVDAFRGSWWLENQADIPPEPVRLADAIRALATGVVLSKYQFAEWQMADKIMQEMQSIADEVEAADG